MAQMAGSDPGAGVLGDGEKTLRRSLYLEKEIAFLVRAKKFQNCCLRQARVGMAFGSGVGDGKSFSGCPGRR